MVLHPGIIPKMAFRYLVWPCI